MAKGRGGLGRGLESLFEDAAPSFEADTRIETLPLREIEPDPGPVLLFLLPLVSSLPQPSIFTSASPIVSTGSAAAFPRRRLGTASAGRLLFTNSMARSIYASLPLPFGS